MPVGTNPLNTADWDWEYSTNQGSAYTPFDATGTVRVTLDEWARKVIERHLHNQDAVLKHLGKINYGNARVEFEHHSAMFNVAQGWVLTRNTEIYLRGEPNDTGGTNDSRVVLKGYAQAVKHTDTTGDDETALSAVVIALNDIDWTAGV